jgi:ubiquinol-cytochrome c reductase cytochrome c1 subunit
MSQPLFGDDVYYADGSPNELADEAEDVAAFLTWAAEPKMMVRKRVGFLAVTFLSVLSVLLYFTNKRIWKPIKNKTEV